MLTTTPQTPFRYLLETKKTIPAYQRDFVWEQDQVEAFIENIWDASQDDSIENYFCGSMVLFESREGTYEIVDGQQRTTVVHIMACCLIHMVGYPHNQRSLIDRFLVKRGITGEIVEHNFFHRRAETNDFFEQLVNNRIDRESTDPDDATLQSLYDGYETVQGFLKSTLHEDQKKIIELLTFLTDKSFVVHHLLNSMADALLTYSRLNAGGKPLGHLEIVKGLLYASAEKQRIEWQKIENRWDTFWLRISRHYKIGGNAPTAKEIIKQETFLTYFLLTHHSKLVDSVCGTSDGFAPSSKLIKVLQHPKAKDIFGNPEETLKQLSDFADKVINMRTGEHKANRVVAHLYKDIALLSQSQTSPLIFMLTIAETPELEPVLLEYVYRLTFMFTTSVSGSGSTQGTWRKLAKTYRELKERGATSDEILQALETALLEQIAHYYQLNFVEYLRKEDIFASTDKLKKTLRMLEIIIRRNAGHNEKIKYADWYLGSVDVDHINPKNTNQHSETVNTIGNATLLSVAANRSIKDIKFNNDKKKRAYSTSEFFQTKSLVTEESDAFGNEKNIVTSFSVFKKADPFEIKKRSGEIETIFKEFLNKKN